MDTVNGRWHMVSEEAYTRKDGTQTALYKWQSKCVECGAPIFCKTPKDWFSSKAFGLKRCDKHKAAQQ